MSFGLRQKEKHLKSSINLTKMRLKKEEQWNLQLEAIKRKSFFESFFVVSLIAVQDLMRQRNELKELWR